MQALVLMIYVYMPVVFTPNSWRSKNERESVRSASIDADAGGGLGGVVRASIRRASI